MLRPVGNPASCSIETAQASEEPRTSHSESFPDDLTLTEFPEPDGLWELGEGLASDARF